MWSTLPWALLGRSDRTKQYLVQASFLAPVRTLGGLCGIVVKWFTGLPAWSRGLATT